MSKKTKLVFSTNLMLHIAAECIRKFGYQKVKGSTYPTSYRMYDMWCVYTGSEIKSDKRTSEEVYDDYKYCSFSPFDEDNKRSVESALNWISELDTSTNCSSHLQQLKDACTSEYVTKHDFGLIASLFTCYNTRMDLHSDELEMHKQASNYVGTIGDKIEFDVDSVVLKGTFQINPKFKPTKVLEITDTNGNVYVWSTTTDVSLEKVSHCKGTVKDHELYMGVKQTRITRCKFQYKESTFEDFKTDLSSDTRPSTIDAANYLANVAGIKL